MFQAAVISKSASEAARVWRRMREDSGLGEDDDDDDDDEGLAGGGFWGPPWL
jgi:hypothetical protein